MSWPETHVLLGRPLSAYTPPAVEAALRGDLKLAIAEHRRALLLETRPTGELVAGPGYRDVIRIDGQEVEVGATAGRVRSWWSRLLSGWSR